MAITVPQLDHQVFTPGPARDYAAHALQIASQYPDYAKMFRDAQAAEMQRQTALQKYQNDALKAQAFLDMYPDYRAAQIAQLQAKAAQANAMVPMYGAHADYYRARSNPADPAVVAGITGKGYAAPPIGAEDVPATEAATRAPTRTDTPAAIDTATEFGLPPTGF